MENDEGDFCNEESWKEFLSESDKLEKEIDTALQGLDKVFDLYVLLTALYECGNEFQRNLKQLDKVIEVVGDKDHFLLGCLICNICSALEGFAHVFLNKMLESEKESEDSKEIIDLVNQQEDMKKKFNNIKGVVDFYNKQTLNNPFKILELFNLLFNLNIKYDEKKCEESSKKLIVYRNAFTHNNGYDKDGKLLSIGIDDVKLLLDEIHKLVGVIIDKTGKRCDRKLDVVLNEYGLD